MEALKGGVTSQGHRSEAAKLRLNSGFFGSDTIHFPTGWDSWKTIQEVSSNRNVLEIQNLRPHSKPSAFSWDLRMTSMNTDTKETVIHTTAQTSSFKAPLLSEIHWRMGEESIRTPLCLALGPSPGRACRRRQKSSPFQAILTHHCNCPQTSQLHIEHPQTYLSRPWGTSLSSGSLTTSMQAVFSVWYLPFSPPFPQHSTSNIPKLELIN